MKKIILTISFLLIGFFALGQRAEAQIGCANYGQEIICSVLVNGCWYDVQICYDCPLVNLDIRLYVAGYSKVHSWCTQSWNENEVLSGIYEQVADPDFVFQYLCNTVNPLPCSELNHEYFNINVRTPDCWYKEMGPDYRIWTMPCIGGFDACDMTYAYCLDENGVLILKHLETYYEDQKPCPVTIPADPQYPGESTDCFQLSTPCN